MKKAGILVLACVAVLCMAGCGFEEGAGATVTIVHDTPTPIPTPTPEATPTPEPTPTPAIETEKTASGVVVSKIPGTYVTTTDVNLRDDASAEANLIIGVMGGTELTGTGVCDNGWIQINFDGQTVYASGDYLQQTGTAGAEGAAEEATAAFAG